MAECHDSAPEPALPAVEDATLADMSGPLGLTQAELWAAVGDTPVGSLGAWALGEATRLQATGISPRDSFLAGVGYAVTAMARQLRRDADKETVARLLATVPVEEEA
jgi:hypothetical protein